MITAKSLKWRLKEAAILVGLVGSCLFLVSMMALGVLWEIGKTVAVWKWITG